MPRLIASAAAAAILFSISVPAGAQIIYDPGVRVGGNTSTISASYASFERLGGFQLAAHAEFVRRSTFSLQVEIEYAQRGYASRSEERTESGELVGIVRAETSLDYLSLPVLARFRYPVSRTVTPYAVIGPSLDVLIARSPGEFEYEYHGITLRDELSDHFAEVSLSGRVGVGAAVVTPLGGEMRLELRAVRGLRDLLQEEGTGSVWNQSLELAVGFTF